MNDDGKINMNNRIAFIVCWFGKIPNYFEIWAKSCSYNKEFDFLIFTDDKMDDIKVSSNVHIIKFNKALFLERLKEIGIEKVNFKKSYRLCDFRPMYGHIFEKELKVYDYWGYCDIDLIWGNIVSFISIKEIYKHDAIFNAGHFTLFRNIETCNDLYKKKGALFSYKSVVSHDAIFAFDETTGIQRIARKNNLNAVFRIPYIDADSRYRQLRSRLSSVNPDIQGYYWENGELYRVKVENDEMYYQTIAYIHLQKRTIDSIIKNVNEVNCFWITPNGFIEKNKIGKPDLDEVTRYNPYEGNVILKNENEQYKRNKLIELLKRTPFQIYVRIRQQIVGINNNDNKGEDLEWQKF